MRVLHEMELDEINGAADGCLYNGQLYSAGAVVAIGTSGYYQECKAGGTAGYYWSDPFVL